MKKPLVLFAPGAGAPSSSAWMQRWRTLLGSVGTVVPMDYEYMLAGRRSPDPLPKLVARHRAALNEARAEHEGHVVLIGKSMGGRIGCHVALEEPVSGVVCLGYPLKAMGKTTLRDEVLRALKVPILFVQGTKDNLCPLDLLEKTRREMRTRNELHVVDGGNHSLEVPKTVLKRTGRSQDDVDEEALEAIAAFTRSLE